MADPANTKLGLMLLDKITPVVMVLSTQSVEDSCRKNGLSLIEMLAPFCNFDNVDVPVRTASDQPYRLRKFKLRLFYASEIRQPDKEATRERLKQVVSCAGETDVKGLFLDPPNIASLISNSNLDLVPSWFQIFNGELVDAASFSEHEAFDHPVSCLVAVSSKDEKPIDKCVELFNSRQLPSLLNDGAMDPKILKLFLLLHDNQDGTPEITTEIFSEMRKNFGANASHLLCINSSTDGIEQHKENLWAPYNVTPSDEKKLGCLLNVDDIEELRNTMHDISSKRIIPHMEVKIRVLNQQISATRKGFRNQIKNLWWRKGKDDVVENPNGPMYTFSSVESQIRVLGDYGFMLHDYELALSNYRLISTDYKLDKSWKHYAGVQEVMGLAYFMIDQSRKDAEFCMENAFNTYLKIGSSSMQNAIRCGVWWAEMLKARDQFKDAAAVFFRISGEDPLHSAVMLEQASYCFLLSTPSLLRKCGFHLVLSGELYKKCDQIKHAIRTYTYALSIFRGTSWGLIKDHVHFHIGKCYAFLGMFDEAITHLLEVLSCSHQSKATQELFLRDFLQIVQETGKNFELPKLQLPVIIPNSIKVVYEDHRTYASPEAATVRESVWRSLEDDMIQLPSEKTVKTNWLESQTMFLPKKYEKFNVCVAGETIKVDIGFKNPLQIPLSLSNVTLVCKHSVETEPDHADANGFPIDNHSQNELRTVSGESCSDASFSLSEVDVRIQGHQTVLVQLTVTPKIEGNLKLIGVRWRLSDLVTGIFEFNSEISRRKVPKGKRKYGGIVRDKTEFLVIKSLPRLEGAIRNLPERVYAGDIRCVTLELRNPSKISVKNLKMRTNNPRFLTVAEQEVVNMEFPSGLKKQIDSSTKCMQFDADQAHDIFVFPNTTVIPNETPLQWPLWFRAATSGRASLLIAICYETEDGSSLIMHRTLRMQYDLEVLPSLEVSFKTSPCPSRLQEFLVRMDVVNRTSSDSFLIRQLSCVGHQWHLELLKPVDSAVSSEILMAGQALSSFFKLQNHRMHGTTEEEISPAEPPRVTNVRFLDSDPGGLLDTSSPPFLPFHYHERRKQERPDQDHGKTVDFILISELWSDADDLSSRSRVHSHHTCHCRVASPNPVWWLIEGPRFVTHDFSKSFCEIKLKMIIYNSLEEAVSVSIQATDPDSVNSATSVAGNTFGWYDTSRLSEMRVTTDVMGASTSKTVSPESGPAFVWSGSSSTQRTIESMTSSLVPLQIAVFSPGTFDLSNYTLHWNRLSSDRSGSNAMAASGISRGQSYHISVLPRESVRV